MSIAGTSSNGNSRQGVAQRDVANTGRVARERTASADTTLVRSTERTEPTLPTRGGPVQQMRDRLQIWVWQRILYRIASVTDQPQQHKLPDESDFVKPIPVGRRYPGLAGTPLIFSEETPPSERHNLLEVAAIRFMMWLKEWYALGPSLTQTYEGIGAPYPDLFARAQPRPNIPEDFLVEDKLARVAARGPFSLQTTRIGTSDNDNAPGAEFAIDLSALDPLEPRAPFVATGGIARFVRDGANALRTVEIEFRGQKLVPGQPGWSLAERRFLTALNNNTTVVEHLVRLHIASAGVWGIVARMALSTRHPLRVLLQPFTEETNRVNNYNIDGLILSESSNVPSYTGYNLEQASVLIRQSAQAFDIRMLDPEYRARVQGQLDDPAFPTVNSAVEVYRIFHTFARNWCQAYLKEVDLETQIFCEELDFRVANGVRKLIGIDDWAELTIDHVAHLLAVGAFAASVGHHIVNDLTRDYFLSFHIMPPAIDAQGHPSLGVVLEKQGSVFEAGIMRYKLLSQAALSDETGKRLWSQFQQDLVRYEASLQNHPDTEAYRIHPSRVASSIHA